MRLPVTILLAIAVLLSAHASHKYNYTFHDTPVSQALVRLCKDHNDLNITFIYTELDNYRTSARIDTDQPDQAIRKIIGLCPISVIRKGPMEP